MAIPTEKLPTFQLWPLIINWIKLCYSNIESCVLNNGWSTDSFKLERGVRQGCPLSPYLFILGVEILAEKIRTNKSVKGIRVQENEIKLSQYADDTTLILDGSKESFTSALQDLDNFSAISGLRLNSKQNGGTVDWHLHQQRRNTLPRKRFKMGQKQSESPRCLAINLPRGNYGAKLS